MKKLVAMLLCLAMLLSLTAFAAAEEKTTVVFWYSLEGTNAECIKQIVDDFNKSQDKIFVDAQYQGAYDDAINKLKAAGDLEKAAQAVHASYEPASDAYLKALADFVQLQEATAEQSRQAAAGASMDTV